MSDCRVALATFDLSFHLQEEVGQSHRRVQSSFWSKSHSCRKSSGEGQVSIPSTQPSASSLTPNNSIVHSLIGEHIDYALFGVFPAAVERDILIALAPRPLDDKPGVVAANAESKYTEQTFTPSRVLASANSRDQDAWLIDIDTKELRWDSYVKAGYYVCPRNLLA